MTVACSDGLRATSHHFHEVGRVFFGPIPELTKEVPTRSPHAAIEEIRVRVRVRVRVRARARLGERKGKRKGKGKRKSSNLPSCFSIMLWLLLATTACAPLKITRVNLFLSVLDPSPN